MLKRLMHAIVLLLKLWVIIAVLTLAIVFVMSPVWLVSRWVIGW